MQLGDLDKAAVIRTAKQMGVDPNALAGLIHMESGFRPNVWGGDGGNYRGLIQFGPGARSEVGLPNRDMTIAEQMPYVKKYFDQRGFKAGMSPTQMYRTVLVGNPYQSGTDSNETNSDTTGAQMGPGGSLYKMGQKYLGTEGMDMSNMSQASFGSSLDPQDYLELFLGGGSTGDTVNIYNFGERFRQDPKQAVEDTIMEGVFKNALQRNLNNNNVQNDLLKNLTGGGLVDKYIEQQKSQMGGGYLNPMSYLGI